MKCQVIKCYGKKEPVCVYTKHKGNKQTPNDARRAQSFAHPIRGRHFHFMYYFTAMVVIVYYLTVRVVR